MNTTFERYRHENIECPYCKSMTDLYNIGRHMKGKRCQKYKSMYLKLHTDKSEPEIELYINSLKKDIINNEKIDEDEL
jgi:transposase-like protein